MNNNTWKSIAAVFAGAVVAVVLSIGTDLLMHKAGIFPTLAQVMSNSLLLLAAAYRAVYGVLGSYVAARLAPNRPMMHALVLGAIGLAVSVLGAAVTWNKEAEFGPHWYPLALVVLAMPQAWLGGKLRELQLRTT
jgi:drug/metabolite transporter (DMT)-like permease